VYSISIGTKENDFFTIITHDFLRYCLLLRVIRNRQINRFLCPPRDRYKLPKTIIFGGKDEVQRRRKGDVAGGLEAEREERVGVCEGERDEPADVRQMDQNR